MRVQKSEDEKQKKNKEFENEEDEDEEEEQKEGGGLSNNRYIQFFTDKWNTLLSFFSNLF